LTDGFRKNLKAGARRFCVDLVVPDLIERRTPDLGGSATAGRGNPRFASLRKPHAGGAPALPPPSQERHSHDDVTKSAAAAIQKARLAEDAWNTRDPARVATGYTPDSVWRNRAEFLAGREAIVQFLARKWARELDYRLIKELWAFHENRIAVRFAYEWRDDSGHWFRSYGNENWEFDANGLMARRIASINDLPIHEADRQYRWPLGRRPDGHPGLSDLGL